MKWVCAAFLIAASVGNVGRAEWTAPAEGTITDAEVTAYITATKAWLATTQAAGKALEGSSGLSGLAVISRMDSKFKEILAKNNLSDAEYSYVAGKTWEAYSGLMVDDMLQNSAADLKKQQQHNADEIKRLTDAVAADKAALAAGTRTLSPDQRSSMIESAKGDQQSAKDEAEEHRKDAAAIGEEIKKAQADIEEKRKAIDHPPADLSADDKPGYLNDRKAELDQAKEALTDAKNRQTEANKAAADADARAASLQKAVDHPEIPQTDDDKTAAKAAAQEAIDHDSAELQTTQAATDLLKESVAENEKQAAERMNPTNLANVEIMRKHRAEFEGLFK